MKFVTTLEEALAKLQDGGMGVLPTDTVYGLVARAADKAAVKRFYSLKHREHKPGTVVAASVQQLIELGLPEAELRRVAHLWPNSLGVVVSAGEELMYLHQGLGSLVVRVPNDKEFCELLRETGPLISSSANMPGEPSATTIAEAQAYFDDDADFYIDGGDLAGRKASTIIRLKDDGFEVLRMGAVDASNLSVPRQ